MTKSKSVNTNCLSEAVLKAVHDQVVEESLKEHKKIIAAAVREQMQVFLKSDRFKKRIINDIEQYLWDNYDEEKLMEVAFDYKEIENIMGGAVRVALAQTIATAKKKVKK